MLTSTFELYAIEMQYEITSKHLPTILDAEYLCIDVALIHSILDVAHSSNNGSKSIYLKLCHCLLHLTIYLNQVKITID